MEYNREVLLHIFEDNGVFVNPDDFAEILEMDSITYITLIVDVENAFAIQIPDEQLVYNNNCSFKTMENAIIKIISAMGNPQ
ncbi:MAG: acyl carrier protein [Lachnospiraceae bacterium]|nr:acyl carrier protein [Lachnospiraceae bacterium]